MEQTASGDPHGGSIDSDGAVLAGDQLLINSGYDKWGEFAGNVLLVFELPRQPAPKDPN